ncbi:MAG TPA: NifB/NifX family molybdenum-iron cluster-binding protein [Candidatus Hydrogenedentes bacterium]|jgi:predicted Fe-Mo cluster-binding NifX family protein|nr:MAG: Dinitrogenase iron-molybdenum cofactor [Candidatus Hydrogenedentes bacterium ADurb.Bin170]HNZ47531.1 NifB/NifX family molybdenum-iron cluster-binding protein [Candidatus Hydrogenedentota bacterium]HOD95204.1 NifB/NifX family molybdenum-iron cluster-binding protein [Candidatus Hydrogenedentota bacterium]HOH41683.1 NifB/NifX family molybdenum-iron cluster-binding protein [Candidatus Hydrogenedentota bacterium]HOM47175.1 NifB/NifX family molybdenum-iron cluster-binding protein [Candidatus 
MMRVAIPVVQGHLALHFGHCAQFALVDTDPEQKSILKVDVVDAPEHQPGLLPRWLAERNAQVIIAGGMGARAQALFAENNIEVVIGAPADPVEALVQRYLEGTLESGENVCDH